MNSEENENDTSTLSFTLLSFFISRLIVFSTILLSALSRSYPMPARAKSFYHVVSDLNLKEFTTNLKDIFLGADASWYMEIANYGYPIKEFTNTEANHWVFFPLFPLLTNFLTHITSSFLLSALLINFVSLLIALLIIRTYLHNENFSDWQIKLAVASICFHPLSYFYSAPFTESIFLLTLSSTLLYAQRGSLWASAFAFGLCTISRPTGLLIAPGIALIAKKRKLSLIPFTAISSLPFIIFSIHLWKRTGNPLAWLQNQIAWGRKGSLLDLFNPEIIAHSNLISPWSPNILHLASLCILLYVIIILVREKNWGYLLMAVIPTLSAINSGTLLSVTRLTMPLLSIPITLVRSLSNDVAILLILTSAFLLGIMTLLYTLGVSFALA